MSLYHLTIKELLSSVNASEMFTVVSVDEDSIIVTRNDVLVEDIKVMIFFDENNLVDYEFHIPDEWHGIIDVTDLQNLKDLERDMDQFIDEYL